MIRENLSKKEFGKSSDFRWRGAEGSRLESLTDGVFAFAITLLNSFIASPKFIQ